MIPHLAKWRVRDKTQPGLHSTHSPHTSHCQNLLSDLEEVFSLHKHAVWLCSVLLGAAWPTRFLFQFTQRSIYVGGRINPTMERKTLFQSNRNSLLRWVWNFVCLLYKLPRYNFPQNSLAQYYWNHLPKVWLCVILILKTFNDFTFPLRLVKYLALNSGYLMIWSDLIEIPWVFPPNCPLL